ncbi:hypothetical protein HQ487_03955 [Candidatus Uhrbacteria bacterium]|nr:hypothetical protein [Candidatus Uhrbacteria bacterium]
MKQTRLIIVFLVGVLIGVCGVIFFLNMTDVSEVSDSSVVQAEPGTQTFVSSDGAFSLIVPDTVRVSCGVNSDDCMLISPTDDNPQPVPDMTIGVKNNEVIFRSWENFDIPYFNDLVSSFKFLK